jgi:hypothetical protein
MQSGIITICGFLSGVMLRRSRGNIICPDTIRACQSLPAHNNNVKQVVLTFSLMALFNLCLSIIYLVFSCPP